MTNDWTQPLCLTCYAAFCIGAGMRPSSRPTRVIDAADPCLICGEPTGIYVRIDPELSEGFAHAREREP